MEKFIKFCPRCKSTNTGFGDGTYHGSARDICLDCGFGKFELDFIKFPLIKKIRKKVLKKQTKKKPQKQ